MTRLLALLSLFAAASLPAQAAPGHSGHSVYSGHSAQARLIVDNDRLVAVSVTVDGRSKGTIAPESEESFPLSAGYHTIIVRAGSGDVVYQRNLRIHPREIVEADVAAYEGRLLVRNDTGRAGELMVEGRSYGALAAGAERALVLAPRGGVDVTLRDGALTLDSGSPRVLTAQTTRYVAKAPTMATVKVRNPLAYPVKFKLGEGKAITVQPGRSVKVSAIPVGPIQLTSRALDGVRLERRTVDVLPYAGAKITLEGPRAAMVSLHNIGSDDLRIWVDGQLVTRLDGWGDTGLELTVGSHQVIARTTDGQKIFDQGIDVSARRDNELIIGAASSCPMPADSRYSVSFEW